MYIPRMHCRRSVTSAGGESLLLIFSYYLEHGNRLVCRLFNFKVFNVFLK